MITGGHQYPRRGPHSIGHARSAQLIGLQRQYRSSDAMSIERVRLARSAVSSTTHSGRFHDLVTGLFAGRRKTGAVGGDALDHPEHGLITAGPARGPRNRAGHPRGGGRELGSIDHLTSGSQDCQGVITGVGVDADDE